MFTQMQVQLTPDRQLHENYSLKSHWRDGKEERIVHLILLHANVPFNCIINRLTSQIRESHAPRTHIVITLRRSHAVLQIANRLELRKLEHSGKSVFQRRRA